MTNLYPLPPTMKAPGDRRPVWRGGVIQIQVTRACSLICNHCTQGSDLGGKPVMMTVDEFERACQSLEGFHGVVGVFGGNPCLHPDFDEICRLMRAYFPFAQRGLWTNELRGHGALARVTFNPAHSNVNVHCNQAAYDEVARDWPEAITARREHVDAGLTTDSLHSSPWVAIKDVIPDEAERWKLIGQCTVNQFWSALLGVVPGRGLRAYFCEIAYSQAALHAAADDAADWPDLGIEPTPGWWRLPMASFEAQARLHCHSCGIPLNRQGVPAIGSDRVEFSETHRSIARPKGKSRSVSFVGIESLTGPARPATEYLHGVTPGYSRP